MRLIHPALVVGSLMALSGCYVRPYVYERPGYAVVATTTCDPNYPCGNTYYWDEYREVYVYYDGARYWDATGLPGCYPRPPEGYAYYAPPYGYVPPSAYRAPHGYFRPPPGYVHGSTAANTHGSANVNSPPGGVHGSTSGSYIPPPPGSASSPTAPQQLAPASGRLVSPGWQRLISPAG